MKTTTKYYVYKIVVDNVIRYIGYTNSLSKRELQHNKNCFNLKSKLSKRQFYSFYRINHSESFNIIEVASFDNRVEAKRYECFLILEDHFGKKELKQKVPNISDR